MLKLASSTVTEAGGNQRLHACSISWSASGTYLAMGTSDRMARLWSIQDQQQHASASSSTAAAREILTLADHTGPVDRVRFHSSQEFLLATAGDSTVRLFDVRGASSKPVGKIDLAANNKGNSGGGGGGATDIAWSPKPHILAVTDRNGTVHVLDTRKLSSNQLYVDACIFSPSSHHLVAATSSDGYGEITAWNWEEEIDPNDNTGDGGGSSSSSNHKYVYPAHTGPIYSMSFSPNGNRLATGGGDALVGLWDVDSMVCTNTITRCSRFIRSVSFSHDSQIVATSTEEDGLDFAMADTGELVGKVSMTATITPGGRSRTATSGPAGADEIAFHPKIHLLACARCDSVSFAPLTLVRIKTERV
ncbi:MAG: hypothetical protein SGILL_002432 [Bacillariaceae sp.]